MPTMRTIGETMRLRPFAEEEAAKTNRHESRGAGERNASYAINVEGQE